MTSISLDLSDNLITVIIHTPNGQSRCTIDAEGARDLASALGIAADIIENRGKSFVLHLVKSDHSTK